MTAEHRIKHSSRRRVFIHPNYVTEPAAPLDINTLSNVDVIEELIKLPVGSHSVVIANSSWTKNLAQHFSLEHSKGSYIGACQRPFLSAIKEHGSDDHLVECRNARGLYYLIAY